MRGFHARSARTAGGRRRSRSWSTRKAGETAQQIYDDLYKPGLYRELWFHLAGQAAADLRPAAGRARRCKAFFTLRAAHWPFTLVNTPYAWHWEATYPQLYGYTDDPAKPEQVNVVGRAEPPRQRRQSDQHERRQRPRPQLS